MNKPIKLKQFIEEFDTRFQYYSIVGDGVSITERANLFYDKGMKNGIHDFYDMIANDKSILLDLQEYYVITIDCANYGINPVHCGIVVILGNEDDYKHWKFVRQHCMDDL